MIVGILESSTTNWKLSPIAGVLGKSNSQSITTSRAPALTQYRRDNSFLSVEAPSRNPRTSKVKALVGPKSSTQERERLVSSATNQPLLPPRRTASSGIPDSTVIREFAMDGIGSSSLSHRPSFESFGLKVTRILKRLALGEVTSRRKRPSRSNGKILVVSPSSSIRLIASKSMGKGSAWLLPEPLLMITYSACTSPYATCVFEVSASRCILTR